MNTPSLFILYLWMNEMETFLVALLFRMRNIFMGGLFVLLSMVVTNIIRLRAYYLANHKATSTVAHCFEKLRYVFLLFFCHTLF